MVKLTTELIIRSTSNTGRKIKDESVLKFLHRVTHLYLEEKGLNNVEGDVLAPCQNLSVLYLYDNQLTSIPSLYRNENLTHLYLQNNCIENMELIGKLKKLTKLYLGGNAICTMEGLDTLERLQELYIENQKLAPGEKLTFDPRSILAIAPTLTILNVSGNSLNSLSDLSPLTQLIDLIAVDNKLEDIAQTSEEVSSMRCLRRIDLSNSPICSRPKYRDYIILALPSVELLDNKEVTATTRTFIQNWQVMRETVANQKRQKAARQASVNILEGSGRPPVAGDDGEGGFEMTVGPTMPYGDETERTNNIALTAYELINSRTARDGVTTAPTMKAARNSYSLPALPARYAYKLVSRSTTQGSGFRRSAKTGSAHGVTFTENDGLNLSGTVYSTAGKSGTNTRPLTDDLMPYT